MLGKDEIKIACKHCGQHIMVRKVDFGKTSACPNCHKQLTISGESLIPEQESADEQTIGWLHEIEIILRKMLVGIFRFIFLILPKMSWHALGVIVPWAQRLIRIVVVLAVWMGSVFWPGIVVWGFPWLFPSVQLPLFVKEHPDLTTVGVFVWISLALTGSGWGLVYVKLKRKRQKSALAFPGTP